MTHVLVITAGGDLVGAVAERGIAVTRRAGPKSRRCGDLRACRAAGVKQMMMGNTGGEMRLDLTEIPLDDAEILEQRWGIGVALEMLHAGDITPAEFLGLCEETAEAEDDLAARCAA